MNDRSQGGTAGLRGRKNIELMQNRRHISYDHYGLREPLNDLDEWGRGIQVPATYYMLINDKAHQDKKGYVSAQREIQRRIEQPITMFYT
jgi:hypothetical protein